MNGDVTVLVADGLDGGDLHAGGKNGLHGFHGEGPGEGFFIEELVESFGLGEHAGISGWCIMADGCERSAWMRAIWPSSECSRARAASAWRSKR